MFLKSKDLWVFVRYAYSYIRLTFLVCIEVCEYLGVMHISGLCSCLKDCRHLDVMYIYIRLIFWMLQVLYCCYILMCCFELYSRLLFSIFLNILQDRGHLMSDCTYISGLYNGRAWVPLLIPCATILQMHETWSRLDFHRVVFQFLKSGSRFKQYCIPEASSVPSSCVLSVPMKRPRSDNDMSIEHVFPVGR